jgi:phage/plasmid-associated DNA primase
MSEQLSFAEMLEALKSKINWKVSLKNQAKFVYRQIGKTYFEEITDAQAKMQVRAHFKLATPATVASLVTALCEDTERLFDDSVFLESRKTCVGFLNGVFDLLTGEVRKYQPSDYIVNPVPHAVERHVNPDAEQELLSVMGSWVGEDMAAWMLTLCAYLLFEYPNSEHIWVNFFGKGANGKSVLLELMENILGDDRCIGCDLKNINRFSGDSFRDKWLVVGRDSSNFVSLKGTSFIKTFSGDEKFTVEIKGVRGSFDTPNLGKLIVSTNDLIQSQDRTFGWYRRLVPILFPNRFPRNKQFKANLMKHLPEITRVFLKYAHRYHCSETSLLESQPAPVARLVRETRMMNDRVNAFWEEFFHTYPEGLEETKREINWVRMAFCHNMTMTELYNQFVGWHVDEFGETHIEPSLKVFGGKHGAFLSTDASDYFEYKRTCTGRRVQLLPRWSDYTRCLQDDEA